MVACLFLFFRLHFSHSTANGYEMLHMCFLIYFRLIHVYNNYESAPINEENNRTVQGTALRNRHLKYWSKIILTSESPNTLYITKIIIIKSLKVFNKNVPRVVFVCLDSSPRAPSAGNYYKGPHYYYTTWRYIIK